jgi:hypothetical protein
MKKILVAKICSSDGFQETRTSIFLHELFPTGGPRTVLEIDAALFTLAAEIREFLGIPVTVDLSQAPPTIRIQSKSVSDLAFSPIAYIVWGISELLKIPIRSGDILPPNSLHTPSAWNQALCRLVDHLQQSSSMDVEIEWMHAPPIIRIFGSSFSRLEHSVKKAG